MTSDPQATFVVEYPCDQFCRVEIDLSGERGNVTLQQLREKAGEAHRRIHEPELAGAEPAAPPAEPEPSGRPAATVFLSAPGRGTERRR